MFTQIRRWRAWALALACVCALWFAVPAWGSGSVYSIVVKGTSGEHTLEAYQLFGGTVSSTSTLSFELTHPVWGSGLAASGQEALGSPDEAYSAAISDPAAFAQTVVANGWLVPQAAVRSAYNSDTASFVIHHLEPGFYLIADSAATDPNQPGFAYIPYLTVVAGNVDIDAQAEAPRLIKQFYGGDQAIGLPAITVAPQTVLTARLTVTLPQNLTAYESYPLVCTDTLPPGAAIDRASLSVAIDGTSVDPNDYEAACGEDGTLTVAMGDARLLGARNDSVVTISYELSSSASAQIATVPAVLTYANDPNPGGLLSQGTTAPAEATLTVQVTPDPAEKPPTVAGHPAVPHGVLVAGLGALVLAIAAVVGVITRKHDA